MLAQIDSLYVRTRPMKALTRLISYAFFEGRPLTTRGRWINPLVFAAFGMEKHLPQIRRVEKPVFILGTGRSGTTILGVILSMHCDVGFLNEPKALWHSVYPGEDLIGNYTLGPARYRLGGEDATAEVKKNARRIFGAYLAATCSRRVVDKYPEMIFRVDFLRAIFPDARFLFLMRNGWDTCNSIEKWSERFGVSSGGEEHDWWGLNNRKWNLLVDQLLPEEPCFSDRIEEIRGIDKHSDMAAVEWVVTMKEGMRLLESHPENVHIVRYENLFLKPVETTADLLSFCGLPLDEKFSSFALSTLRKVEPKKPFKLHPAIEPAFINTMKELGYGI